MDLARHPLGSTLRSPQQHEEISSYLRDEIFSGRLATGSMLPSEAELCKQFSASRGPVRQAVATLRAEGLISSGRGRRSTVLSNSATETFEDILCCSDWINGAGMRPELEVEHFGPAPAHAAAAEALGVDEGQEVISLRRIHRADGTAVVVENLWFHPDVNQQLDTVDVHADPEGETLHYQLIRAGVEFNNCARAITVGAADEDNAARLGVEVGAPVMQVNLRAHTHNGDPVEYGELYYRGDKISLGLNNVRGHSSPLWFEITQ